MRGFLPKVFRFDRGQDSGGPSADLAGPGFESVQNLQFDVRGALRTRPGAVLTTGFSRRGLSAAGLPTDAAVADFATTGYQTAGATMNLVRNANGDRPMILSRGRAFTYDGARWEDRLGVLQCRWESRGRFRDGILSTALSTAVPAAGWDFSGAPSSTALTMVSGFTASGDVQTSATLAGPILAGNGAALNLSGTRRSAAVHVTGNSLVVVEHVVGSPTYTRTIVAADARTPTASVDVPCICADFDSQVYFVAYWTTTANQFKVLRLNASTLAIIATHTGTFGAATPRGIWVTNTTAGGDRAVVVATDSGNANVFTRVLNATAMTTAGVDLNVALSATGAPLPGQGAVVCGVAENGEVWCANVYRKAATTNGGLQLFKRSLSAATATIYGDFAGAGVQASLVLDSAGGAVAQFIQHQPVKLAGRVLLGLANLGPTTQVGPADCSNTAVASNWMTYDITDLNLPGTTTGTLRDPVCVARGDTDCAPPFAPRAAVVDPFGGDFLRFPVVRWNQTFPGFVTANNSFFISGDSAGVTFVELVVEAQGVAHHREGTVIAGAVPRLISKGGTCPVGFPWAEFPSMNIASVGGGSLAAGDYSVQALWTYVDEAGQIHRSAPSFAEALTVGAAGRIRVTMANAQFNEREVGTVLCEVYCTASGAITGPHYFAGSAVSGASGVNVVDIASVDTTQPFLYTDGGVLAARPVPADGGVAVVGDRCWVSDGRTLFASRLGPTGAFEAPSWNNEGPLTVTVPGAAGRVVALAGLDDKLLAFCTGGVWVVVGEGPDDTAQGPSFRDPFRISDVGLAGPRSLVATPKGVFFLASGTQAPPMEQTGGIYVVDRGLGVTQVSQPLTGAITAIPLASLGDFTYLPEREQLFCARTDTSRFVVLDTRDVGRWTEWLHSGVGWPRSVACVRGVLWGVGVTSSAEPVQFTNTDGLDTGAGGTANIGQTFVTGRMPAGDDAFGWGRVRSADVLFDSSSEDVIVTATAYLDGAAVPLTGSAARAAPDATWPGFLNPRFTFGRQKCSVVQLQVDLNAGFNTIVGLMLLCKKLQGSQAAGRTPLD